MLRQPLKTLAWLSAKQEKLFAVLCYTLSGELSAHCSLLTQRLMRLICRLERVAAILRREVEGSTTPDDSRSSDRNLLDSSPISFNLERSLAELRQASEEIDRVLREATNDRPPYLATRGLTSQLAAISRAGARERESLDSRQNDFPLPLVRHVERPRGGIIHPVPLRPGALFDRFPQAVPPAAALELPFTQANRLPPGSIDSHTLVLGTPSAATDQPFNCLEERALPSTARTSGGAWRRLDANADEIFDEDEDDELMFRQDSLPRGVGLGWCWIPASDTEHAEQEKILMRRNGFQPSARVSARYSSSSRSPFNGNREMVGR